MKRTILALVMIIFISVIAASWLMQPSPTNKTSLTNTGNSNATDALLTIPQSQK
ncbi:hypothetical protein [Methanobacterium subterraneum]|uniref:Uncharacterized protein n=1 Tax=Methanobacterium subterraneum TaxID=59277 RepID=A0A7K4DJK1_9EURY|nr:hypothetical protein [Methanobacterium subterraneum]NMO08518.1 hypothetical protein [Methanobacterium subterraneum]